MPALRSFDRASCRVVQTSLLIPFASSRTTDGRATDLAPPRFAQPPRARSRLKKLPDVLKQLRLDRVRDRRASHGRDLAR
eukprot:30782-Pelagococcus_subviridis.AAC.3